MTRFIKTVAPSFPDTALNALLGPFPKSRWHVVCGDPGHWRAGLYSPEVSSLSEVLELERHDCPELFLLMSGRVTLVFSDGAGGLREVALEPGRPILVSAPHSGYCPDGPHTGVALVVERDEFTTEYRPVAMWRGEG